MEQVPKGVNNSGHIIQCKIPFGMISRPREPIFHFGFWAGLADRQSTFTGRFTRLGQFEAFKEAAREDTAK